MISGDIINILEILPNNELKEIEQYCQNLRDERKQTLANEYADKLKKLFSEMYDKGFTTVLTQDWEFSLENNITIEIF